MKSAASSLDIEKFRKIHALMTGGATEGERAAARTRAASMAKKAGMTLLDAVVHAEARPVQKPTNFFDGFEDAMEARYPGYKADKAQKLSERERRYAQRRAEILEKFGTLKAFMDPTPDEVAIVHACRPFVTEIGTYEDVCDTIRDTVEAFAGVRGHYFKLSDVDPAAIAAVKSVLPFPSTIVEAFGELKRWDDLNRDRAHFYDHHEYYWNPPIELRIELLRDVMRNQPASSWDDVDARIRYKSYDWEQQWLDPQSFNDPEWARLHADITKLRDMDRAQIQLTSVNAGGSNARTRALILHLLDKNPHLADHDLSRRTGISPEAVGIWRRFHLTGDEDR